MAPAESPIPQPAGLLLPPLLIALGIIVVMFLTLVALHFLLKMIHSRNPPTPLITNQASRGVDKEVLELLPIQAYSKDHKFLLPDHQHECSVCLSPLEDGVLVRILPACRHIFHCQCIDAWFADHASCPFCRAEITAPVSFIVPVDAIEGSNESLAQDCQHRRLNTFAWPSDSRLMSFREKLCLKRSLPLESYNMR